MLKSNVVTSYTSVGVARHGATAQVTNFLPTAQLPSPKADHRRIPARQAPVIGRTSAGGRECARRWSLDLELVIAVLVLGHGQLLVESVARGSILLTGSAQVFGQKTQTSPGQVHPPLTRAALNAVASV